MADDEPPVALYDFLYKDSQRIDSYYAQIFRGLLTSVEDSKTEHQTLSRQTKVGAAVVSGQIQTNSDTLTGSKSSVAPHDMATTDMLAYLIANDHLGQRVQEAGHGALILAKGTLVFVDRLMAEFAVTSLRIATEQERKKPAREQNKVLIQQSTMTVDFLSQVKIPSAYLFVLDDGAQIVGTIKDDGMQEPISTYYFKHGMAGLADVYLIGIKERASPGLTLPPTGLVSLMQQGGQGLSDMLFPHDAIRVTPIALFRKLFEEADNLVSA